MINFVRSSQKGNRLGVTLIEILVVVGIIGVLLSLLFPAAQRAREYARSCECRSNLRILGTGFMIHADRSPYEALTSGALDHYREGCMDTWGWVADQMNPIRSLSRYCLSRVIVR